MGINVAAAVATQSADNLKMYDKEGTLMLNVYKIELKRTSLIINKSKFYSGEPVSILFLMKFKEMMYFQCPMFKNNTTLWPNGSYI